MVAQAQHRVVFGVIYTDGVQEGRGKNTAGFVPVAHCKRALRVTKASPRLRAVQRASGSAILSGWLPALRKHHVDQCS